MAFTATTGSYAQGAVSQSNHNLLVTLYGSWTTIGGDFANHVRAGFQWSPDGVNFTAGPIQTSGAVFGFFFDYTANGSYSYQIGGFNNTYNTDTLLNADTNYQYYADIFFYNVNGGGTNLEKTGSILSLLTNSVAPTSSTPTSSSVTSSSAALSCNFFPNTNVSTATVWLEYRVYGSGSGFTQVGTTGTRTGYSTAMINRTATGLAGNTTYEFRLNMTRNTADNTSFQSSSATFTTLPSTPAVTTSPATNIGITLATLNGSDVPNGQTTSNFQFKWGTTMGGPYPNTAAAAGTDAGFSANITGLTATTTYYFIAQVTANSTVYSGSEVSFTTAASAAQARIMPSVYRFLAPYGTQSSFQFSMEVPSATNSDRFVSTAPGSLFAAGDIKIDKDAGGLNNTSNTPTQVTAASPLYSLTLTAAEMSANEISVLLVDADGPSWRDTLLKIHTNISVGKVILDPTNYGGNVDGLRVKGVGTGFGINATGGATAAGAIAGVLSSHVIRSATAQAGGGSSITLDASASSTNSYYNNYIVMVISGTGSGQARIITGYVGSTQVATVNRSWNTNPDSTSVFVILPTDDVWNIAPSAELASPVPTATSTFANMVQAIWARFSQKLTQTATTQTWFKQDGSTQLASRSVSDNGSTQTTGQIS